MAYTPNSQRTYLTGWRVFCRFRGFPPTEFLAASARDIQEIEAWLSLQGFAPSTIATYLSGVGFQHKVQGVPDPTRDFLVTKLSEGCKRDHPTSDSRLPISLAMLSCIVTALQYVCSNQFEVLLFRAAMLGASFAFMRLGEFTADSRYRLQDSLLLSSDVTIQRVGSPSASVLLTFRITKTNKTGPPRVIRLVQSQNKIICPVAAFVDYIAVRPASAAPFFCHFDALPLDLHRELSWCIWVQMI